MKWEYKTIKVDTTGFVAGGKFDQNSFEQILNELGEQGGNWSVPLILM